MARSEMARASSRAKWGSPFYWMAFRSPLTSRTHRRFAPLRSPWNPGCCSTPSPAFATFLPNLWERALWIPMEFISMGELWSVSFQTPTASVTPSLPILTPPSEPGITSPTPSTTPSSRRLSTSTASKSLPALTKNPLATIPSRCCWVATRKTAAPISFSLAASTKPQSTIDPYPRTRLPRSITLAPEEKLRLVRSSRPLPYCPLPSLARDTLNPSPPLAELFH